MASIQKQCKEVTCPLPGRLFWTQGTRTDQAFCSDRCYQRTRYWEQAPPPRKTPEGYLPQNALSVKQIDEVVVAYFETEEPMIEMAARYEVSPATLHRIARDLGPRTQPKPKNCASPWCDRPFPWARQKKYCSRKCERKVNRVRSSLRVKQRSPYYREPSMTSDDIKVANEMHQDGKSWTFIADWFELPRSTLRRYMNPDPTKRPRGGYKLRLTRIQNALAAAMDRREHYQMTGVWLQEKEEGAVHHSPRVQAARGAAVKRRIRYARTGVWG